MSMSSVISLPIIEKLYATYKILAKLNTTLAKQFRYSLGAETEKSLLELIELLLMAGYAPKTHKSVYLTKAQAVLDSLRLRVRLYVELGLANQTTLMGLQAEFDEAGRMLGGWAKSV